MRPARVSKTATSPSDDTRATVPSTRRTPAKSPSGATWIAAGATVDIVADSPSSGSS